MNARMQAVMTLGVAIAGIAVGYAGAKAVWHPARAPSAEADSAAVRARSEKSAPRGRKTVERPADDALCAELGKRLARLKEEVARSVCDGKVSVEGNEIPVVQWAQFFRFRHRKTWGREHNLGYDEWKEGFPAEYDEMVAGRTKRLEAAAAEFAVRENELLSVLESGYLNEDEAALIARYLDDIRQIESLSAYHWSDCECELTDEEAWVARQLEKDARQDRDGLIDDVRRALIAAALRQGGADEASVSESAAEIARLLRDTTYWTPGQSIVKDPVTGEEKIRDGY